MTAVFPPHASATLTTTSDTRLDSRNRFDSGRLMRRVLSFIAIFVGAFAVVALEPGLARSWAFPAVVGGITFVFVFLRMRRANADSVEGIALLNQGRFIDAVAAFEKGLARSPRSHIFLFNKGVALMSLWRTADAEAAFDRAASMRVSNFSFNLERMLVPQRALAAALLGRVDAARTHLARAEALQLGRSAQLTITNAVLAFRANDLTQARALLGAYEVKLLGGPTRGLADALTAWCVSRLGGPQRPIDKVALYGEAGPDALRKVWPELVEFVSQAPDA
jgi:tetratricopeptide (TPR) repeat protein